MIEYSKDKFDPIDRTQSRAIFKDPALLCGSDNFQTILYIFYILPCTGSLNTRCGLFGLLAINGAAKEKRGPDDTVLEKNIFGIAVVV